MSPPLGILLKWWFCFSRSGVGHQRPKTPISMTLMLIWKPLLSSKDLEERDGVHLKCSEEHLTGTCWVTTDMEVGTAFPHFSAHIRESMVCAERFHPLRKVPFRRQKYKDSIMLGTMSISHYPLSLPTSVPLGRLRFYSEPGLSWSSETRTTDKQPVNWEQNSNYFINECQWSIIFCCNRISTPDSIFNIL